ncbi:NB-ARC domain-containing disease resistance protein [Actinidia rufa]|uniref:NB-ARC domain-containing disease resistance protein n=1 Tax=Actinidia rufa TaxID=165716 RepID=A0A7J0F0R7_9ERIC|nr:NB-ARC domain-containing disease resistance protein [Actinidia rufa]
MAEAWVGGAFLSATLQVLFDRLASRKVLNLFWRPKRNDGDKLLQKLKMKLMEIDLVIDDAERKAVHSPPCGSRWNPSTKVTQKQVRTPISTSSSLLDAEFVSKIEEIVDRLEDFAKQKDVLGLKEVASQKWSHRSQPTSLVNESDVFGRDSDKEEIIKLLVSNEQSGSENDVIPIVGMGGVEEGMLPSTLTTLKIVNLSNLKSLNKRGFQLLCSLTDLCIISCPQLRSLPEEGFSASSRIFVDFGNALNSDHCLKKGFLPPSKTLRIISDCPQLQALPEKGLPPSLSESGNLQLSVAENLVARGIEAMTGTRLLTYRS